ncbi:MAG TPA: hypothetical protein PKH97_14110 [Tetrasphaera sp.]|uniref:Uncharacterized protein n=1 Tax=Nostocoides vanveenii TaxID=330835 RepID=A0ABN2KK19_9MICO|nr:hypothetical protein [Tetrasphaera sp.]HNQ08306.1 hypothetical protein [Tetrasphaera sp.]
MAQRDLLCPSAAAEPGVIVLGIRRADGTIGYLPGQLTADADFVAAVRDRASTDFRFAAPCARGGCGHWRADPPPDSSSPSSDRSSAGPPSGQCSLIGRLRDVVADQYQADELPRCAIRASCRWFAQDGRDACRICPVVTRASGAPASADPSQEGTPR